MLRAVGSSMPAFSPMSAPDAHTASDLKWARRVDEIVSHGYNPQKLPAAIAPDILIGSVSEAQDVEALSNLRVTHIITMASGSGMIQTGSKFYGDRFIYRGFEADDSPSYDLLQHFADCYERDADAVPCAGRGVVLPLHGGYS
jgi:hypothetical protein